MPRRALLAEGERLLGQAALLRAAYPDDAAMRLLPVAGPWDWPPGGGEEIATARAALGNLRDEMLLVRDGRATSLGVLDDEIACTRRLLARL
jgi:hypothetical protein